MMLQRCEGIAARVTVIRDALKERKYYMMPDILEIHVEMDELMTDLKRLMVLRSRTLSHETWYREAMKT